MVNLQINTDMLPMKGHFFFFNAGTAPLVPYLPVYAKQLGFSSYIVGIIYTFLPIFGLLAKPIFGAIADRFRKHKLIFILFQVLTIAAFSGLYFIPEIQNDTTNVKLTCGDGETFFEACYKNSSIPDKCATSTNSNKTIMCDMKCSIPTRDMWQTICEHWKIPNYCYDRIIMDPFEFKSYIPRNGISMNDTCIILPVNKTSMADDLEFIPKCPHIPNIQSHCNLFCADKHLNDFLSLSSSPLVDMICAEKSTNFNICGGHSTADIKNFISTANDDTAPFTCNTKCFIKSIQDWGDICDSWNADKTAQCRPKDSNLPTFLEFTGTVPLSKTIEEEQCLFFKLQNIKTRQGSSHYPMCPRIDKSSPHFKSDCSIKCSDSQVHELLKSSDSKDENGSFIHEHLWTFFLFMALNWIGMAVVVSIGDAICFEKLGDNANDYGRQRLWGSAGWGIFSLLTGILIDVMSKDEEYKDYTIAFILMLIFLLLDILVSTRLQYKQKTMSINLFKNVGILFSSWQTCHFFIWTILVGLCTGLLWQFLFWHLEDLAKAGDCDQSSSIKTLQGLVSGIQCFGGEIPFFFLSGMILKKIGHVNSMTLVLCGFGIRFILYSILVNPWWVLPIEFFQGITFGMLYTTMASYASLIAPNGIEATVMGLVGAVFEGVGTSLGSFIGGLLYGKLGGALTFRLFGCAALVACLLNAVLVMCKAVKSTKNEDYSSIIQFRGQNEDVNIWDEPTRN